MLQLFASIALMYAVVAGAGWFMLRRPQATLTDPSTTSTTESTTERT